MANEVDITHSAPGWKMVIVIPLELKMSAGKIASQAAHAAMVCGLKAQTYEGFVPWLLGGMKKIVLETRECDDLFDIKEHADSLGLITHLVCDEGHTEVEFGSATALAIGPANETLIDKTTRHLNMFGYKPKQRKR